MTLGYPTGDMVLKLKGQGLGLAAIQRGFKFCECLLILNMSNGDRADPGL